ncbi:MAG: hypothetical protein ThorAB25_12680 [Candidatus Thorarchaeota archaeon AB_25]|nr:MAG: hypothetical protein ThorAB25_12680 [Candidatus Thorarchaeota archaeon AB_25]
MILIHSFPNSQEGIYTPKTSKIFFFVAVVTCALILSSICLLDSSNVFVVHDSNHTVDAVSDQDTKFITDSNIPHDPIVIDGDANFSATAVAEGWAGNGSAQAPYIIENLNIDLNGENTNCISLSSTHLYFIIRECVLSGATGYEISGIKLMNVINGEIANNTCSGNNDGITLKFSNGINVTDNKCDYNLYSGIALFYSDSNRIINNTCNHNSVLGITIISSDSNTISDNTCDSNSVGFSTVYSANNMIINCTSKSNQYGIQVLSSDFNTITNCYLSDNMYGISLEYLTSAVIANNTLSSCGVYLYEIQNGGQMLNITDNTVNSKPLVFIQGQVNVSVSLDAGQVIIFNCSSITIQDQTLSRCTIGVFVYQSTNVTIRNIICSNNLIGIEISSSANSSITNNICLENNHGIVIGNTNYTTIRDNTCTNNSVGINVHHSTNDLVSNNNCEHGQIGIGVLNSVNIIVKENICKFSYGLSYGIWGSNSNNINLVDNILIYNVLGIHLEQCDYNEIENNVCTQNFIGIFVDDCMYDILNNNTATHNFYGIFLRDILFNYTLERNTCNANNVGITLEYCGHISLYNNVCNNNSVGIDIFFSHLITVADNHLTSNNYCIQIRGCQDISIIGNTCIDYLMMGIRLDYSCCNFVSFNNCTGSLGQSVGINLHSSTSNTISNNTSTFNNYGIQLTQSNSSDNVIIWNVFAANIENGHIDSTGNLIHHNFWSDYQGDDDNQDGIGDTPYIIPGIAEAQDEFPLMDDPYGTNTLIENVNQIPLIMELAIIIIGIISTITIVILIQKRRNQT